MMALSPAGFLGRPLGCVQDGSEPRGVRLAIANVLDSKPPSDFETYGAIGYNPLDYSGAIGRYFRVGAKYTF